MRVARMVIQVVETGQRTIDLGTALLPNGYLTQGSFAMADPWPSSVLFATGPRLVVRPTDGGEPIWNVYETGWHHGTYEVDVALTFDVAWFEPGTSFTVVDLVVR
jgi:hypothetical protein